MKQRCWKQMKKQLCPKQKWVKDDKQSKCLCCCKQFKVLVRRRHHCRFCGNIFCSDCSDYFVNGNYVGVTQKYIRHCQFCHKKIQKFIHDWTKIPEVYDEKITHKDLKISDRNDQTIQNNSYESDHHHLNEISLDKKLQFSQQKSKIAYDANQSEQLEDFTEFQQYQQEFEQLDPSQLIDSDRYNIQDLFQDRNKKNQEEIKNADMINSTLDENMSKIINDATNTLCQKWNIDKKHWKNKLIELATRGAVEAKMDSLANQGVQAAMDIARAIKIKTLVTEPSKAIQIIMKGIVLQKNPPTKHAHIHLSKPTILIIQKSIDLDSLTSFIKFEQLIKNDKAILRKILQKIIRLNPDIIFVQQNVNVFALQYLQSREIVVISKLKPKQLQLIKQISGIKKPVKKLWMLEKYKPSLILGRCQKIYFKAFKANQYMMFMQADLGVRTIIIGQQTQQEVNSIKRTVQILLRLARQLYLQKHFILIDHEIKLSVTSSKQQFRQNITEFSPLVYNCIQSYLIHQELPFTKILYSPIKMSQNPKIFQQYGQRTGKNSYRQICGKVQYLSKKIYTSADITLGGYILWTTVNLDYERMCKKCNSIHKQCFYTDGYAITIQVQRKSKNSLRNISPQRKISEQDKKLQSKSKQVLGLAQSLTLLQIQSSKNIKGQCPFTKKQEEQINLEKQKITSNHTFIQQLNIKNQELTLQKVKYHLNKQKQLIVIETSAKCETCGKDICKQPIKVGKFYLSNSFHHILYLLVQAKVQAQMHSDFLKKKGVNRKLSFEKCFHPSIIRVYQYSGILLKFKLQKVYPSSIDYINLYNKTSLDLIQTKQKYYIENIYIREIKQKQQLLQRLCEKLNNLPFPYLSTTTSVSLSQNYLQKIKIYMQYGGKLKEIFEKCQYQLLKNIQEKCFKQLNGKQKPDWTFYMRKILKVDSVIRLGFVIVDYIQNNLKKKKVQDNVVVNTNISNDKSQIVALEMQEMITENQDEQNTLSQTQSPSKFYRPALIATQSGVFSQSGNIDNNLQDNQIRNYMKSKSKKRYPRMQGVFLHFHTTNITDPVGLLACGINSNQYRKALEQFGNTSSNSTNNPIDTIRNSLTNQLPNKYEMSFRISLQKILKTDWPPRVETDRIYYQLYGEIPEKIQIIDITAYYPRQFEQLRKRQNIDSQMYVRGLCTCKSWDSSGGKSNSLFSKAQNDLLVVKVINEKQFEQFLHFTKVYLEYMEQSKNTLLAKVFGIYQVLVKGKAYKCVVMQNIFFGISSSAIVRVYDLKGSQVNRLSIPPQNSSKSFTGQDTNFKIDRQGQPYPLKIQQYDKLIKALEQDSIFLKEQAVIDYSLLAIETKQFIRLGIIDYMRPYHLMQKLQKFYKQFKSGRDPTVIPPASYAQRFIGAMKKYFIKIQ